MRVELRGLDDVLSRLEAMKRGARNRIVRGGIDKANTIIKKSAQDKLGSKGHGVQTKLLKRSVSAKTKTYPSSGVVIGIIGPRADMRQQVDVSAFPVFRQVGGTPGKKRGGKFVSGVFGKTVRITNPQAGKLHGWPTMMRNPVKYAHLVEKGFNRGSRRNAAYAFLQPGFDSSAAQAAEAFRSHCENEFEKLGV